MWQARAEILPLEEYFWKIEGGSWMETGFFLKYYFNSLKMLKSNVNTPLNAAFIPLLTAVPY